MMLANVNASASEAIIWFYSAEKTNKLVSQLIVDASREKNSAVIYTGIRTPSSVIVALLDKMKPNYDRIYMIDAMGKSVVKKNVHIKYIDTPTQLTEISISINMIANKNLGKKITLILDSISALTEYVDAQMLVRFLHYLISRAKSAGMRVILIADKNDRNNKTILDVAHYCDKIRDT
ncbi:MAG: DUF7504 family protein [Candidatus Micrarchaeia archaeon]